jgi:hypothetical protein
LKKTARLLLGRRFAAGGQKLRPALLELCRHFFDTGISFAQVDAVLRAGFG